MDILKSILESIHEDAPVKEVLRGMHWTAVVSRRCGLASTMLIDSCSSEMNDEITGTLTDKTALEIAGFCMSDDVSMASLGLAAINSLINVDAQTCPDVDGLKLVRDMGEGKNITVIGHFPFLDALARVARSFWVIEKHPRPGDYPEESGRDYLPQSDIVVISSTTLINHTLPGILSLCKKDAVKMLLGPTTPMTPVLFDYGIDILSGSVVTDQALLFKYIGQGAGFKRIKQTGSVRFVTLTKNG